MLRNSVIRACDENIIYRRWQVEEDEQSQTFSDCLHSRLTRTRKPVTQRLTFATLQKGKNSASLASLGESTTQL